MTNAMVVVVVTMVVVMMARRWPSVSYAGRAEVCHCTLSRALLRGTRGFVVSRVSRLSVPSLGRAIAVVSAAVVVRVVGASVGSCVSVPAVRNVHILVMLC